MAKLPKLVRRPVDWIGSSKDDVSAFPQEIKDQLGQSLFEAELGDLADNAKQMKGELREVTEIVAKDADNRLTADLRRPTISTSSSNGYRSREPEQYQSRQRKPKHRHPR